MDATIPDRNEQRMKEKARLKIMVKKERKRKREKYRRRKIFFPTLLYKMLSLILMLAGPCIFVSVVNHKISFNVGMQGIVSMVLQSEVIWHLRKSYRRYCRTYIKEHFRTYCDLRHSIYSQTFEREKWNPLRKKKQCWRHWNEYNFWKELKQNEKHFS